MNRKILFVEDDVALGFLVKEALEHHGFEVNKTINGADAITQFKVYRPHLCLLDVMLPGKDGYAIAGQIRADDTHVPIIFLTAKIQAADLVKGFKAGCNDYIRKPFHMEELLLRVDNWLEVKYGAPEKKQDHIVEISTFMFDPVRQVLSQGQHIVKLSHKETELLQVLLNFKNAMVSRDYILQKVWGADTVYHSRTLDVYINRLRKYFSEDHHIDIITLKGIGYRFIG